MTEYGYTYSFHPARVVHMYPLAPMLARDQPTNTKAPIC